MKSKIGLLSFPRYFNYGTLLQLHALQRTLEDLGYAVEVIDYDPYNDSGKREEPRAGLVWLARRLLARAFTRSRGQAQAAGLAVQLAGQREAFERFLKEEIRLGQRTYFSAEELEAAPPDARAFVVGSDQVWHPDAHCRDRAYFLSFAERRRRVAYAPSFGVSEIPLHLYEWFAEQLAGMTHLSVREQAGADLIRQVTGREAQVVLDPVFLPDALGWGDYAAETRVPDRPYLLCYFLESDVYMRSRAMRIARDRNLQPFMIPVHVNDFERPHPGMKLLKAVGPKEFVGLVGKASFVCTDSFHGTAFSILLNRPFATFRRYDNPLQVANHSRLDSILALAGLGGRLVGRDDQDVQLLPDIDFADANQRVRQAREESLRFLRQSLVIATAD